MKKYLKFMLIVILLFTLCIFVVPNSLSKYKSTIKNSINITIKRPEYTVKFNANGGTGSMSDISVKRDVSQALPSNTFTRSGYDFIGWNTNADGSGVSYSNGQEIAYASISDGEIITLYAQWYNKNYLNDTTELSTYSCEEEVKTFTASITGNYVLEAWGAQGGNVSSTSDNSGHTIEAIDGGKGGYSYGIVHLNAGDNVYVTVGCQGKELKNATKGTLIEGGYNGGGRASSDNTRNIQSSGGGATHFAINNNLGVLENYVNNQSDVLVVAGGGGGSYNGIVICYYSFGGYGGGLTGGSAQTFYKTNCRSSALVFGEDIYYQGLIIPGADQTSHTNDMYYYGSFGHGANAKYSETGDDAGAGGGWYGGNKLRNNKVGYKGGMAGSGGSGHVNLTTLIEGNTIAGNMNVPTHNGSSYMIGNNGDGYARISFVNPHYTIKFDANGGTGSMNDMNFVYGTAQNLTNNAYTKTNYAFVGWNTKPDGSGTSYTNGQSVNNLSTTDGDEIILYAQWIAPNIYFQVPPDWYGSTYNVYFFNTDNNSNSGWPGSSLTLVDSTKNIYSHTLTDYEMATYNRVVFTNGENVDNSSGLNGNARQTIDVVLTSDLYGKIFVPELYSDTDVRVFFRSGTTSWIPFIYLWGSNGSNAEWPGVQLIDKINTETYLSIIDVSLYNMMIFNKGTGGTGNQTADLNVPIYQDLTFNLTTGPYRIYYYGTWHNYSDWLSTEYSGWSSTTGDYAKFQDAQTNLGY